jgi:hypothetical protein
MQSYRLTPSEICSEVSLAQVSPQDRATDQSEGSLVDGRTQ